MSRITPSKEFQYAPWERIARTDLPQHDGRTLFFIRRAPDSVGDTEVLVREANGMAAVPLPQRIVYHSPTGFEWGYGGSGPADLALNILTLLVSPKEANRMHQDFKSEYIATMPREGGELPMETVRQWIAEWYRASEEPDAEHNDLVAVDGLEDGAYIADRVAERDDAPPAPYE